jgi:hypothetical protein
VTYFPGTPVIIDTDGDTFISASVAPRLMNDEELALRARLPNQGVVLTHNTWWQYVPLHDGIVEIDATTNSSVGFAFVFHEQFGSTMADLGAALQGPPDYTPQSWGALGTGGFYVYAGHTYYIQGVGIEPYANDGTGRWNLLVTGAATDYFGPTVVLDPWDHTVNEADTASFRSLGAGRPTPTRQWQKHPPGDPDDLTGWADISGETGEYLTFTATLDDDGCMYRAVYTSTQGVKASAAATLTIGELSDPTLPEPGTTPNWTDVPIPDATAGSSGTAGSMTVLEAVRQFSIATRQAVRIIDDHNIEVVDLSDPLPIGIAQADAASMYHSITRTTQAGEKTLSLEETDLVLSAHAEIVDDDVRIVESAWKIPNSLPVYGLAPAAVARVAYNFTPNGFTGSLDFAYPQPLTVVRRSS